MIEDLKLLIELQGTDTVIIEKSDIIETIPGRVTSVEQPLKDARGVYDRAKQKLDGLVRKKKDREQHLEDINEKIKKLKARISDIKTNKEYQAHLKEIESAEKDQRAVEDEVLAVMEALDTTQKEVKALEVKVKAEEEKINAFKKKLQEDVAAIEKEIDDLRLRREGYVRALDREVYSMYTKLFEARRGLAVVETRGEVCRGCNMNIPPQLFVEIKKNEKIIQCPQCNRILYWKAETV
ncbi:MAG: C4-type zinc ribbon domain-containing protein [Nitrospirae bacterium]|nr:C4-type zinc ribbon domain-containing protein [Nitrospirota bacterium]MCL5421761.1 C4-type zinc ribbon domain-containing protein [Nitrospirota bacterium]